MFGAGRSVRGRAIFLIIAGIILLLAGILAWVYTTMQLSAQHIRVPTNQYGGLMSLFSDSRVNNPLAALAQAGVIREHAMASTGGLTFAEIPLDDPIRDTAFNASLLQGALFTSVLAFGLSLLSAALGVLFIITGSSLLTLSNRFDGLSSALANGGYGGAGRLVGAPAEGVVLDPGVSYTTTDYVVPTAEYVQSNSEFSTDTSNTTYNEYYENRP